MSILSPALLGAAALVLLASAVGHLARPSELQEGLRRHGVLPPPMRRATHTLLPVLEIGLAVALLVGLVRDSAALQVTAVATAALFAGFGGYLLAVMRRRPETSLPCSCGVADAPVGAGTVGRAAALAAMALVGAVTVEGWLAPARPLAEVMVAAAAAATLAVTTLLLPAARALPVLRLTGTPGGVS